MADDSIEIGQSTMETDPDELQDEHFMVISDTTEMIDRIGDKLTELFGSLAVETFAAQVMDTRR
jgi:hypothetical protein